MGFTPLFAVAKCFHKEKTPSTGVNGVKVQFRSECAAAYVKRRIISWAVSTRRNMGSARGSCDSPPSISMMYS